MKLSKIRLALLLSLSTQQSLANTHIDDTVELDTLSEVEQQFQHFYDIELPEQLHLLPVSQSMQTENISDDNSYIFSGTMYALTTMQGYMGTFFPALKGSFIVSTPGTYLTYYALDYAGRVIGGVLRVAGQDNAAAYFPNKQFATQAPSKAFFGQDVDMGKYEWVDELIDVPNQAILGTAYSFSELSYKLTNNPIDFAKEYIDMHEDVGVGLTCNYTGYCNNSSSSQPQQTKKQKRPEYYQQYGDTAQLQQHTYDSSKDHMHHYDSPNKYYHLVYIAGSKHSINMPTDSSDAYIKFRNVRSGGGDDFLYMASNAKGNTFAGDGDDLITNFNSGGMYGEKGDDIIIGKSIYGEIAGFGGEGGDFISRVNKAYGGSGKDKLIWVKNGFGGTEDDLLVGTNKNDVLEGGFGNDLIEAGNGLDTLDGGDGNDILRLDATRGDKIEIVNGGLGEDALEIKISQLMRTTQANQLQNGQIKVKSDALQVMEISNIESLHWRQVLPTLNHDQTIETKDVNLIPEHFTVDASNITINQVFTGQGGLVTFLSGSGDDVLIGGALNNTLKGGKGDDVIRGGQSDDNLYGGMGNDLFIASLGNDFYYGSTGIDTITLESLAAGQTVKLSQISDRVENLMGTPFVDELHGNHLENFIAGGQGSDKLYGHDGQDILVGDKGADTLNGGANNDILIGGSGRDIFVMSLGNDVIEDFGKHDRIDLSELGLLQSDIIIERREKSTFIYSEDISMMLQNYLGEISFIESKD
ncbi:calcium-binding protein [Pseudoalteromonas luteoviolacea]|uniref:calcium-binding protein n=1 Tax=Pseudoalteromonas luteoviolacea TaxID=43657 RepID=UPI001F35A034|nr:calcium-binding protein [Pseudoalteromonas luteoviolacea]MCF6439184.1 calcium-binding protein [Pseudoalteromonas luteoviolacea]